MKILDGRFPLDSANIGQLYRAASARRTAAIIEACGTPHAPMPMSLSGAMNSSDPSVYADLIARARQDAAKLIRRYRRARRHMRANPADGGGVERMPRLIVIENFGYEVFASESEFVVTHFCHAEGCARPFYMEGAA